MIVAFMRKSFNFDSFATFNIFSDSQSIFLFFVCGKWLILCQQQSIHILSVSVKIRQRKNDFSAANLFRIL